MKIITTVASTIAIAAALSFTTSCGQSDGQSDESGSTEVNPVAETETAPAEQSESKVELAIELPKPQFQGTPKPVKLPPGLKLHKAGKRPPFMVPEGTVNLSKEKMITASDDMPIIGDLEQLVDDDKAGTDGSFVEFGPGTQWVQIDLEENSEIAAIMIWHYHAQARVYHDVIVQISDDEDFLSGVTTLFNNDHDNSSGKGVGKDVAYVDTFQGWLVDSKGTKGQYVRLYSNGSTSDEMNHYIEVSVYGKKVQ